MKRFNYDEGEDFGEENLFPNNEEIGQEEYAAMMERRDSIDLMQLELAALDLKQQLLFKIIKMLEKSFWWKFKSSQRKLSEINISYNEMLIAIYPQESVQEEKQ